MILWGANQTTTFTHHSGAQLYYLDITFRNAFKEKPIIMATGNFTGGIVDRVGTLIINTNSFRLASSDAVSGLWVQWVAIGKWK